MRPAAFPPDWLSNEMVANIDIAPSLLSLAGIEAPRPMHGRDFSPLARGEAAPEWRTELYYEYFWNWVFPQTPTSFALRTDRFKLIQYHGIWDTDELYDLRSDPLEMRNLIAVPEYKPVVRRMRKRLYELNLETGGTAAVPYTIKEGHGLRFRKRGGAEQAEFPESIYRRPNPPDIEEYKD